VCVRCNTGNESRSAFAEVVFDSVLIPTVYEFFKFLLNVYKWIHVKEILVFCLCKADHIKKF
jgi:hypothetical protein